MTDQELLNKYRDRLALVEKGDMYFVDVVQLETAIHEAKERIGPDNFPMQHFLVHMFECVRNFITGETKFTDFKTGKVASW